MSELKFCGLVAITTLMTVALVVVLEARLPECIEGHTAKNGKGSGTHFVCDKRAE